MGRVQHSEEGVGMGLMFLDRIPDALASMKEFIDSASSIPMTEAVKETVLIVHDNVMHRRMNRSRLVLEGFMVLEALQGTFDPDAEHRGIPRLKQFNL